MVLHKAVFRVFSTSTLHIWPWDVVLASLCAYDCVCLCQDASPVSQEEAAAMENPVTVALHRCRHFVILPYNKLLLTVSKMHPHTHNVYSELFIAN